MIEEIQFPSDPENYVFYLQPRQASVYLIARAKQHYGSLDGLNIVCNYFRSAEEVHAEQAQYQEICRLAEAIGIPHLRFVWLENVFQNVPTIEVTGVRDGGAITDAYLSMINLFDPTAKRIDDGGLISTSIAVQNLTLLKVANLINEDMTPNTDTPHKTIAVWHAQTTRGPRNTPSRHDMFPKILGEQAAEVWNSTWPDHAVDRPPVWAPLFNYTLPEVLSEADKHGLLDVVLMANNCEAHDHFGRPGMCGMCHTCIARRHSLLQAGLDDPTIYG